MTMYFWIKYPFKIYKAFYTPHTFGENIEKSLLRNVLLKSTYQL